MTEKRFRITDNGIEDTLLKEQYTKIKKSDEVLDSISFTHLIDLVKLLNELHEENQSLKEENKFLRNKVATYKTGNRLLKESMNTEWK